MGCLNAASQKLDALNPFEQYLTNKQVFFNKWLQQFTITH